MRNSKLHLIKYLYFFSWLLMYLFHSTLQVTSLLVTWLGVWRTSWARSLLLTEAGALWGVREGRSEVRCPGQRTPSIINISRQRKEIDQLKSVVGMIIVSFGNLKKRKIIWLQFWQWEAAGQRDVIKCVRVNFTFVESWSMKRFTFLKIAENLFSTCWLTHSWGGQQLISHLNCAKYSYSF